MINVLVVCMLAGLLYLQSNFKLLCLLGKKLMNIFLESCNSRRIATRGLKWRLLASCNSQHSSWHMGIAYVCFKILSVIALEKIEKLRKCRIRFQIQHFKSFLIRTCIQLTVKPDQYARHQRFKYMFVNFEVNMSFLRRKILWHQ